MAVAISPIPFLCTPPHVRAEDQLCPWSAWSPCSQSCGTGLTSRTRSCVCPTSSAGANGDPCVQRSPPQETEACYLQACRGKENESLRTWDGVEFPAREVGYPLRQGSPTCEPQPTNGLWLICNWAEWLAGVHMCACMHDPTHVSTADTRGLTRVSRVLSPTRTSNGCLCARARAHAPLPVPPTKSSLLSPPSPLERSGSSAFRLLIGRTGS